MLGHTGYPAHLHPSRVSPAGGHAFAALLDHTGPVDDARVLLLGPDTLELMCALIGRGCASVTALRPADRPESASAEVAIVPKIMSAACADQVLSQAKRALMPLGSLILRLPADAADPFLLRHLDRSLRLHGFSAARTTRLADQVLLRAEVPLFGRLMARAA